MNLAAYFRSQPKQHQHTIHLNVVIKSLYFNIAAVSVAVSVAILFVVATGRWVQIRSITLSCYHSRNKECCPGKVVQLVM